MADSDLVVMQPPNDSSSTQYTSVEQNSPREVRLHPAPNVASSSSTGTATAPLAASAPHSDEHHSAAHLALPVASSATDPQQQRSSDVSARAGAGPSGRESAELLQKNELPSDGETKYSFSQQMSALIRKSAVVQKRQYKTNCCQLLFPVFLLGIMAILQAIVTQIVQDDYGKYNPATPNPAKYQPFNLFFDDDSDSCTQVFPLQFSSTLGRYVVAAPPSTQAAVGTFSYNSTGSGLLGNVSMYDPFSAHDGILMFGSKRDFTRGGTQGQNYVCTGRPVQTNPVNFYTVSSQTDADDVIFHNWKTGPDFEGGYTFQTADIPNRQFSFAMYGNNSLVDGRNYNVMLNLLSSAVFRIISPNFDKQRSQLQLAGVMDFPAPQTTNDFDIISIFGPVIYVYIFQLLLPVMMSNIVYEKENKLREIMKMMGLKSHIYWIVTYLFNYVMYLCAMLLMVLIAVLLGFRYYTVNDPGTYLILLFLWGHTMVALAFFFSVFFSKSSTATLVGYIYIIATGLLATALINTFFDDPSTSDGVLFLIQLCPSFALDRGLHGLGNGVSFGGSGVKMSMVNERWIGLSQAYGYLVWEWFVLMLLAFYLDAVIPSAVGVKREACFCCRKSFWRRAQPVPESAEEGGGDAAYEATMPDDLRKQLELAKTNVNAAVRVLHLRKVFEKSGHLSEDVVAVRDLSMVINRAECFGFLGPNGAGKSTTINMLCGYTMPSTGHAYINKFNIREDMDMVHMVMGVCPQDNVLWESLTGGEHLSFYGRMKGLSGAELEEAIVLGLRQVQLLEVRNKRSGEYSGGMKRRLCVAIALIGDPKIVLLDEPTTGLDPASRRSLWNVIKEVKRKSCMLLTTHSMEEAEFLCDRLAIFDKGALQCVGTSADLKHRFERGYKFTLTTSNPSNIPQITQFVKGLCPSATMLNSVSGTANYELKKSDVKLSNIFRQMAAFKKQLKITDWGISNTTLEEVFVRIARGDYAEQQQQHNGHNGNGNHGAQADDKTAVTSS